MPLQNIAAEVGHPELCAGNIVARRGIRVARDRGPGSIRAFSRGFRTVLSRNNASTWTISSVTASSRTHVTVRRHAMQREEIH